MPIRPQFRWEQDAATVRILVPLKGIPRKDVDIYSSGVFIKVNFAPYLLSLDLAGEIRDHDSRASFKDGTLLMTLPKVAGGEWATLEVEGLSKADRSARRAASVAKREAEDAELDAARKQRKAEASDLAFRRHMALENAEREELESRKAEEKRAAEEEVYSALAKVQRDAAMAKAAAEEASKAARRSAVTVSTETASEAASTAASESKTASSSTTSRLDGCDEQDDSATAPATAAAADAVAVPVPKAVPVPRSSARVAISFSERAFPTPLRQSKMAEEQDWLARNKHLIDARRRAVSADKDGVPDLGDISKRDPDWLKAKGDEMLRAGDVVGAANTYSEALKRDPTHLGSLGNRAVARLRLGHDQAAALDCTTALLLLPLPPVDPAPPLPSVPAERLRAQATAASELAAKASKATAMSSKAPATATAAAEAMPDVEPAETRADRRATISAAETLCEAERLLASSGVSSRPALSTATPFGPRRALRRALGRRAAAFLHMGQFARAAADYRSAAACAERDPGAPGDALSPSETAKAFEADALLAERLLEAEMCKRQGDDKLKANDTEGAVADYDRALAIEPTYVPALVNRATALSLLDRLPACVDACSAALSSLGVDDGEGSVEAAIRAATAASEQGAFVPCWGSVRLAAWIKSACLRRAVAWMKLGDPKQAARDYRKALETDPLNARIMRDMQQAAAAMLVASGAVRQTSMDAAV